MSHPLVNIKKLSTQMCGDRLENEGAWAHWDGPCKQLVALRLLTLATIRVAYYQEECTIVYNILYLNVYV